ncbi:hypothetical protein KEJ29_03315 [Candidatus Bathyarchaeota archaeon]|nr:hypothetical protein [Candidatus Bathyarchaeota archaeon]
MGKMMIALIMVAVFAAGSFLSYIWVAGYLFSLELRLPETPTISICNLTVSAEDPTFFNVTILNPSFAPRAVEIMGISVLVNETAYKITVMTPSIPSGGYRLEVGEIRTFKCHWLWADYAGKPVSVMVFVREGSGAVYTVNLPLVAVEVGSPKFDPELGDRFSIRVRNSDRSVISVDVKGISIIVDGSIYDVEFSPPPPIRLNPNGSIDLTCRWNWAEHQGKSITVIVETSQGYMGRGKEIIPTYAIFAVSNVNFNPENTTCFSITVANFQGSLVTLNITDISIKTKDGLILKPLRVIPNLPYILKADSIVPFICEWNWTQYAGEEVTLIVSTGQGYKTSVTFTIPYLPEETMRESAP